MAFKKMTDYNEERYGGKFILRNDGDFADVIFLYKSISDVLVADAHYIKSEKYNGYVHCCGVGCPACAKEIRVQNKLFIPLYNIQSREIEFWDRTVRFERQLISDTGLLVISILLMKSRLSEEIHSNHMMKFYLKITLLCQIITITLSNSLMLMN